MKQQLICHDFRECRFIGIGEIGIETVKFISSHESDILVNGIRIQHRSNKSIAHYPKADFLMNQQIDFRLFVFCIVDIDDDTNASIAKNFSMSFTPNELSYDDPYSIGILKCSKGVEYVKEFTSVFNTVIYVDNQDMCKFENNYRELLSRPVWTLLNICLSLGLCYDYTDVKTSLKHVSIARLSSNFIEFIDAEQKNFTLSSPIVKDTFTFSYLEYNSEIVGEEWIDNLIKIIDPDFEGGFLDDRHTINCNWHSQYKMPKYAIIHSC